MVAREVRFQNSLILHWRGGVLVVVVALNRVSEMFGKRALHLAGYEPWLCRRFASKNCYKA